MVTMILPVFQLNATVINNETYRPVILNINKYNKKFCGLPRSFMDYVYDLPTLLRHAFTALFSLDGLAFWYRIRVVFIFLIAICYLISPLDFFLAIYISIIYRQVVANRA